jgi:competence protein ComGC
MMRPGNTSRSALTLVDLLMTIAIVALLALLLVPAFGRAKVKAQRIGCVSCLKQIGLSFRIWSGDNTNLYPMSVSTNFGGKREHIEIDEVFRHFQVLSNELYTAS